MDTLNTIHSLQQLFEADLKEQLHCETALSARIPFWLSEDTWHPLALLIREYIGVVATHTRILRGVGGAEVTQPSPDHDAAGVALLDAAEQMMGLCKYPEVRESCIVEALQTLMHLKIQRYGTLAAYAIVMGRDQTAAEFHQMAEDEKFYDLRLSHMAKNSINPKAVVPLSQMD